MAKDNVSLKLLVEAELSQENIKQIQKQVNDMIKNASNEKIKLGIDSKHFKEQLERSYNALVNHKLFNRGNTRKINIAVNQSMLKNSINSASTKLNSLKDKNITITANTKNATSGITAIYQMLHELSSHKYKINLDVSGVKSAETSLNAIAKLLTRVNKLANKLNSNSSKINTKVNLTGLNSAIKKLKDYVDLIKKANTTINTTVNTTVKTKNVTSGANSTNVNTNNAQTSPKNLHNNYKSMQAEAVQYAKQAEMAWRNAGNKSSAEFEKFKNKFQKQMEKMVEFRKNLGNLSAGAEANIFSNMARSIQKNTPLYDQLINKVKQLKKEQAETHGKSSRISFLGSLFTGTTQFVGRSSKGFGSFGEAVARVNENMIGLGGTFGKVGLVAAGVTAVFSTVIATGSVLVNGLKTFGGVLIEIGQIIYNAFKPAIELYKSETKALFGMGAAVQAQGYVGGVRIGELTDDKNANANTALGISTKLLNKAMLDAEKSVFDFSEIIQSLQGTLPMLMSKGFSLDQAYRINMGVAAAAKTLQLAPNQVLQETRDIAQNSITSRTSQVANALHITNAELKQFNGDVEATFEYLMKKFEDYSEMLNKYALTPVGAFERMRDRLLKVGADIVEQVAPMFMGLFNKITDMTGHWVDNQGNQLDIITNKWKQAGENFGIDENGLKVEGGLDTEVGEPFFKTSDIVNKLKDSLIEIIEYAATAIDTMWEFAKAVTGANDPIDFITSAIKTLIDITLVLAESTLTFGKVAYDAFMGLEKPIMLTFYLCKKLFSMINLVISAVGQLLALDEVLYTKTGMSIFGAIAGGVAGMSGGPLGVVAGAMAGANSGRVLYHDTTEESASQKYNESAKKTGEALDSLFSSGELSYDSLFAEHIGDGVLGKAIKEGRELVDKLEKSFREKAKNLGIDDVKGNPEGAKGNIDKEALRQQKKMLNEQLRGLREALKDALSELKDILNKNKIAYDEGFMSIKDYFSQKAEIEAKEAELRLTEAMEELEKINSIQWENEYDKDKELHRVNREIRQYSRELKNAKTSIAEVSKAWKEGVQSLNSFTAFIKNAGGFNGGMYYGTSGASQLKKADPYVYIAKEVAKMIQDKGGNTKPEWIYGQMIQEVGRENMKNGGSSVSKADNNFSGLKWYPGASGSKGGEASDGGYYQHFNTIEDYIKEKVAVMVRDFPKSMNASSAEDWVSKLYSEGYFTGGYNSYVSVVSGAEKEYAEAVKNATASINTFANDTSLYSSQIEGAASVLLSDSGEVLGYTPEEQYSRGGIDTRYANFQSMSSGVDAQISGMNDSVKQVLNLINKMYYEKTGTVPTYSSFTGDMTGATRNPHSSASYGHRYGFKADAVDIANEKAWVEIHKLLGVATRWENHHWDSSYGPGHTYGGGWGTDYLTGDDWWNKVQNAQNVSVREGGLGFLPGASFQTSASTTATGSEYRKKFDEYREYLMELESKAEDVSLETISASLNEIQLKYDKEFKKLELNIKNSPELSSSYELAKENLNKLKNKELTDAMVSFLDKRLSYVSDYTKTWGNYNAFESFMGRGMSMNDFLTKYHKYYFNDDKNPIAPASVLSKMWDSVIEYQKLGAVDKAQELRNKILDKYDELNSIFTDYLSKASNYFDNYSTWLNNTDATSLQKERGEREIRAKENEVKSNILGVQISNNEEQLAKWKLALDEVLDRMEKLRELQKDDSITEEEKEKNKIELDNLEIQKQALSLQSQKLEMTNEELKVQKLLADQLKQQPNVLKDLRKTAKQALEDGLVTFLTDGVNEAESLGEALRNLAVNFLKTMQEFFAKQIVTGLMNKWFPVRTETDEEGVKQTPFAMATNYNQKFGGSITQPVPVNVVNGIDSFNYPMLSSSKYGMDSYNKYSGLGEFSSPWGSSELNINKKLTKDFGIQSNLDYLSNKDMFGGLQKSLDMNTKQVEFASSASQTLASTNQALNATSQASNATISANTAMEKQGIATNNMRIETDNRGIAAENMNTNATHSQTQAENSNTNELRNNTETQRQSNAREQSSFSSSGSGAGGFGYPFMGSVNAMTNLPLGGQVGGIGASLGNSISSALSPVTNLINGISNQIASFLNSPMFTSLLSSLTSITGSAGAQLAGGVFAIGSIINGDTKEKLLGSIFLETQLLYIGQQQTNILLQTISARLLSLSTTMPSYSTGFSSGFYPIPGMGAGIKTLASGGMVYGEGTSTSDSIPAMLSNGEAVLNAKAVKRLGTNFINSVNNGSFTKIRARIPHLAEGGVLGDAQQMTARGMTDFANSVGTNVSTTNQMNIALVRDEREAMEHFMRSPAGQRVLVDFQKGNGRVFSRFGNT